MEPAARRARSYLFGAIRRLPLDLQILPIFLRNPTWACFTNMLPYLFTIIVLVIGSPRRCASAWAPRLHSDGPTREGAAPNRNLCFPNHTSPIRGWPSASPKTSWTSPPMPITVWSRWRQWAPT